MRQWGIRQQVLILTLLPALLIALILTVYFTFSQIKFFTSTLNSHGMTIASQISPAAEYAVFSGNIDSLRRILKHALTNNEDVIRITITSEQDEVLLTLTENPASKEYPDWLYSLLTDEQALHFRHPIETEQLELDDNLLQNPDETATSKTIG